MWLDRDPVVWRDQKEIGVNEADKDPLEPQDQLDHKVHKYSSHHSLIAFFLSYVKALLAPRETRDFLVLKELKATLVPLVLLARVDPLVLPVLMECE